MNRIFYLVLMLLTAAAAAVQWMPRDGFPPDFDLGPDEARAQAGPQVRPQQPIVRTADGRRVAGATSTGTAAGGSVSTNSGPTTIYPAAQPPAGLNPSSQPPISPYPVTPYSAMATPDSAMPNIGGPTASSNLAPAPGTTAPPTAVNPATPLPSGLPGTAVYPANQFPAGALPASPFPHNSTPTAPPAAISPPAAASPGFSSGTIAYPATSNPQSPTPPAPDFRTPSPIAPASAAYAPSSLQTVPSTVPNTPPAGSYSAPAAAPPTAPNSSPVNRPTAPSAVYSNPPSVDPFGTPGTPASPPGMPAGPLPVGRPTVPPAGPAPMPPPGGYPTTAASAVVPSQPPLPIAGPVSWAPAEQELEATRVLARVGAEIILAGEVISSVNSYISRQGHDYNAPEVLAQRDLLVRSRLNQLIELRAVLHEARRKIPADAMKKAIERFDEDFDKTVVPQMLKERKLVDMDALDEALKKEGTTLDRMRRDFAETVLFKSWLQQCVEYSHQVTHEEMLDHYQKHIAQYEFVGECRWEQLTARFDQFPTKAEAYQNLAHWGNQVIIGQSWAEVARKHSQGSTASQGGGFDWTKKGSLVSKSIDEAIFTLPVGSMSPIVEDDKGFHIVRVVERKDGGRTPFTEAQGAIKKKIMEERSEVARKDYIAKIRKNAIVWNAFDDPATAPSFNIATPPAKAPVRR